MPSKKARKPIKSEVKNSSAVVDTTKDFKAQQDILNVFRSSFAKLFEAGLKDKIQAVKGALYKRDFVEAFGSDQNLEAYAVRWSPSRALAYHKILERCLGTDLRGYEDGNATTVDHRAPVRILSMGGGAGAELMAVVATLRSLNETSEASNAVRKCHLLAVDIAAWSPVLDTLYSTMTVPAPLSKYAAPHVVAANKPFLDPTILDVSFQQHDVLSIAFDQQLEELVREVDLATCFFTMNELFSTSISATNRLLLRLKESMPVDSYLLVVDSAGSYSTVALNDSEKTYPMQWLLDHTMLAKDQSSVSIKQAVYDWTKVISEDSTWFRIPDGLKYPLELENMRYQLHLYQKRAKV